ncbi:MAG: cytochrome b [Anaerolineales bacterium]
MSTGSMYIPTPSSTTAIKPKRYHPALVALHWVIFIMIFATAFLGGGEGGEGRRAGGSLIPGFPTLGIHIILGIVILLLLILRLVIRWRTKRPQWASTGSTLFDRIGELTHWALYFFTFVILITGMILSLQGDRLARTFGFASSTLRQFPPGGFEGGFGRGNLLFQLGRFHGLSWALLFLLILFHVGAAFYHQFIIKDNLLGRKWFGRPYE